MHSLAFHNLLLRSCTCRPSLLSCKCSAEIPCARAAVHSITCRCIVACAGRQLHSHCSEHARAGAHGHAFNNMLLRSDARRGSLLTFKYNTEKALEHGHNMLLCSCTLHSHFPRLQLHLTITHVRRHCSVSGAVKKNDVILH